MTSNGISTAGSGLSYLALGDSYTIGQSVNSNERFPYYITSSLRQLGLKITDPDYIATTGWTTQNLLDAIRARGTFGPFDIVTLLIGVNDQYQHLDTAGYRIRFTQLLNRAIELTGNRKDRAFILSIPDYSATPFVPAPNKQKVSEEIDQFNKINKEITIERGVAYIDITPLTKAAANDPSLLANDGLHYSGKEHQLWAEKATPVIYKVLQ
ncbi:MAG TPA: SGNH/GDSL hydrolase family protein [Chitinophagaceae bacterium]|nr:SGNH/GDSL hydrolase family protein [Chitinophagaceae bacterium]